jgi:hypothetical protein
MASALAIAQPVILMTSPGADPRPVHTGEHYIALVDGLGLQVPVKCVIIGPGVASEKRVRSLLG